MHGLFFRAYVLSVSLALQANDAEEPEGLLQRIQARIRETIEHQPDYICLQTVNRWVRSAQEKPFEKMDTLRLEVGLVGNREVFAWKDSQHFEERELAELVNKGTIGTGDFAIHVKNIFLSNTAVYSYKGQSEISERKVYMYEYGVPIERSRYRMRVPPHEGIVGYSGTFQVDAATLDLIKLEVIVDEIPEKLGLAQASSTVDYAHVMISDREFLLPKVSELKMLGAHGEESRNEISFSGCRLFTAESAVRFDERERDRVPVNTSTLVIPPKSILDLELSVDIDLVTAAVGDSIRTTVRYPLREGTRVIVPAGAAISGHLVRLDRSSMPFDHFEIGLTLDALEVGSDRIVLTATLDSVRGSCIVDEQKRIDPVFTGRRSSRLDILVREMPKGQGVIHCDAKQGRLKKGTQMKWISESRQSQDQ